jgi:hypothetical protein
MIRRYRERRILFLSCLILLLGMSACARIKLQPLPQPPPTARLRVLFLPVSDALTGGRFWKAPQEEYAANIAVPLVRFLGATGIYEMVPQGDVEAALSGRKSDEIDWNRSNWAPARNAGRAVHADYVVIARRGYQGFFFFQLLWINLDTGKVYETLDHPGPVQQVGGAQREFRKIIRETYHEIFQQAKADLLATAIRKGRHLSRQGPPPEPAVKIPAPEPPRPAAVKPLPSPPTRQEEPESIEEGDAFSPAQPPRTAIEQPQALPDEKLAPAADPAVQPPASLPARQDLKPTLRATPETGKMRLIVQDLEAPQPMQVAALILTEALREEIYKLGSFELVNREDLTRAMEELKLQHSGLVQEEGALRMGRWLAAKQSVTGRLGSLGRILLLQVKYTDIETLETLAVTSLKAQTGNEEDLLNGLPDMARRLLQKP